jgi:hypothetical protein
MELPTTDHQLVYTCRDEYERLSKAGSSDAPEACLRQGGRGCSSACHLVTPLVFLSLQAKLHCILHTQATVLSVCKQGGPVVPGQL